MAICLQLSPPVTICDICIYPSPSVPAQMWPSVSNCPHLLPYVTYVFIHLHLSPLITPCHHLYPFVSTHYHLWPSVTNCPLLLHPVTICIHPSPPITTCGAIRLQLSPTITLQRSSWYVCTCDTAVGLNWPNLVQLHCARIYPSPSRFPTRFPRYKLLPKQSGPDRPPAQYNWTKSSLYSCQEFKLSKSQAGCWQWEFAS